jgi:phosphatidylglycerophosphate synthase
MSNPYLERMPLWLTGTVIGRDVIIVSGSVLLYVVTGNVTVKPLFMSKTSAVLQMMTIGWVLFKLPPIGTFGLAVAVAVTTAITGVLYVSDGIRQFSEHPAANPKIDNSDDTET